MTSSLNLNPKKIDPLIRALDDESIEGDPNRLAAAYTLAHDKMGVYELIRRITSNKDCVRRCVAYGLGTVRSSEILEDLVKIVEDPKTEIDVLLDILAVFGWLGGLGVGIIPTVLKLLNDDATVIIRRNAADVLGHILYWVKPTDLSEDLASLLSAQIKKSLGDPDAQTRFNLCSSIGKCAKFGFCADFVHLLEDISWNDKDRYARAYALDALQRINTLESISALMRVMWAQRHCSLTNENSPW